MIVPRTAAEQRLLTMVHEARNTYHAEAAEGEPEWPAWTDDVCEVIKALHIADDLRADYLDRLAKIALGLKNEMTGG